jgi:hypothetical protein
MQINAGRCALRTEEKHIVIRREENIAAKMGRSKAWEMSFHFVVGHHHHGVFLIFAWTVISNTVGSGHTLLVQSTSCCSVQVAIGGCPS